MRRWILTLICLLMVAGPIRASDSPAERFDTLLKTIRSQTKGELAKSREREQRFRNAKKDKAALLAEAKAELQRRAAESEALKARIDANEKRLSDTEAQLHRKMGDLGELFGVIRQIAGEIGADFAHSMISVHYPERSAWLHQLSERKELPDIAALSKMWVMMLEELDESRQVSRFTAPVVQADGTAKEQEVVRIGAYGAVSEGAFLTYSSQGNVFTTALKQPQKRYLASANNFASAAHGLVKVMIDPTRGQLIGLLTQKPDLKERIRQGGLIGAIILGLGGAGLLLCLVRYSYLSLVHRRIKKQARKLHQPRPNNPLGRIALVYDEIRQKPKEQREVIWEEAILKEIPLVEKYNPLIKLLAAIAPLLGLLGTVTGMIITFQSITLFGTSDPKLMAGGISTALITTVLGLSVAIPLLFAHTFIAAKSKSIIDVIEHQSIGLIAKSTGLITKASA
jgi:biopolymer transport protein ExbB